MKTVKLLIVSIPLFFLNGCFVEEPVPEGSDVDLHAASLNASDAPFNLSENDIPSDVVTKLQLAINTAQSQNKKLIVDRGTYTINSQIKFPSNVEVDFSGAEFIRESGTGTGDIFDMFTNSDHVNGNTGIVISNLIINGNRVIDNLSNPYYAQRFSGLKLINVSRSKIESITVTETVNAEDIHGGIYFRYCNEIVCNQLDAYANAGSGIYMRESIGIRIYGSYTYDNFGSGITSLEADRCEYHDLVSHDNGFYPAFVWGGTNPYHFSNISVNGEYSKVDGVLTYHATGSGLNIGHTGDPTDASYTIVDNVESYDNHLEGITITNSDHVMLSNVHVWHNLKNNVAVRESDAVQINGANLHDRYDINSMQTPTSNNGLGLLIDGGGNHSLDNILTYNNWSNGIMLKNIDAPTSVGSEVHCYNNGMINEVGTGYSSAWTCGIQVVNSEFVYINGSKAYQDDHIPSGGWQMYGIILQNVNHIKVIDPVCYENSTSDLVLTLGTNGSDIVIVQ